MRDMSSLRLTKQNVAIAIFILFLILLSFLPRIFSLSLHWATDEDLWMQRSRNFYFALKNGEFEDTHVAYHPGVTTCWLGSLAIWLTSQPDYFNSWLHSDQFMSPGMLARVRFPIVFLSGMLTLIAGILLYRLFDALLACIGTLFLAIEPFLISESRRAHFVRCLFRISMSDKKPCGGIYPFSSHYANLVPSSMPHPLVQTCVKCCTMGSIDAAHSRYCMALSMDC